MDRPFVPLATPAVSTGLFLRGGTLLAPVFSLPSGGFSPLHRAPWIGTGEAVEGRLGNLQGDFFCCPFGGNATPVNGVQHAMHGNCANEGWDVIETWSRRLVARFIQPSLSITKVVELGDDHPAIYQKHYLSGEGWMSYGHHVMLQTRGKQVRWWTAPFRHGQVFPGIFEGPETQGRQALQPGAEFTDIRRVPGLENWHDISRRPHAPAHEDLCEIFADPDIQTPWHAALYPGSPNRLWVTVRDRSALPATVIWMSEGGRDYAPWSGRHTGVLALEDVCSHFHYGLAESIASHRADRPTSVNLGMGEVVTRTAMTVLETEREFSEVLNVSVEPDRLLVDTDNGQLSAKFRGDFVLAG